MSDLVGNPKDRFSHNEIHFSVVFREKHCGGIAQGWKVVHKNNVTVDNRMDNLVLVPENSSYKHYEEPSNKFNREQSLYWIAVQHLLMDSLHQVCRMKNSLEV